MDLGFAGTPLAWLRLLVSAPGCRTCMVAAVSGQRRAAGMEVTPSPPPLCLSNQSLETWPASGTSSLSSRERLQPRAWLHEILSQPQLHSRAAPLCSSCFSRRCQDSVSLNGDQLGYLGSANLPWLLDFLHLNHHVSAEADSVSSLCRMWGHSSGEDRLGL